MAIRKIAATLGIARNTVRGYVRGETIPGKYELRASRTQPVQEEVRERVRTLLVDEKAKVTPRKQRLTAARIHRILERDGATVSARTVRTVVGDVRRDLRDALERAYLPLEYRPGDDAQVDFFEGVVDDRQLGRVKVHVLLVRACFSGRCFAYAAPNQTREALLEGLMRAFEMFGGVFRNVWFDNLTPAVKHVLQGRTRVMQTAFESFAAHYGFEPQFCGPAKGNEKGGVEGEVKFSRHEILTPIPDVDGRDDVQELCRQWMELDMLRTIRGRARSIGDMWRDEETELIDLPVARFEVASARYAKVSGRSWIQTGTNFYSVPVAWTGLTVSLKVEAERVVIIGPGGEQVEHVRAYGREAMTLELDHYLPLLARKHRGLDRAVPVCRFLEREDPVWRVLLASLRKRDGEVSGSKDFVAVLQMCQVHGTSTVTEAIQNAMRQEVVSLALVRFFLWNGEEQARPKSAEIEYYGPTVRPGSIADYDALVGKTEVIGG